MDFTLSLYHSFLESLISKDYTFITFKDLILSKNYLDIKRYILLRHDVERSPQNALKMAKIEHTLGIQGSYYFRVNGRSLNNNIIRNIDNLGHEIGYHYNDVESTFWKLKIKNLTSKIKDEDLMDLAYQAFCENLKKLRKVSDIKTICMHGSPLSKYDNRILWTKYNYEDLGIIGEPFINIDWRQIAYFTDTGRRWNNKNVNVRDKVDSNYNFNFKSTRQLMNYSEKLPDKIVLNIHTHRWYNPGFRWLHELIFQNLKNVVKYFIVRKN